MAEDNKLDLSQFAEADENFEVAAPHYVNPEGQLTLVIDKAKPNVPNPYKPGTFNVYITFKVVGGEYDGETWDQFVSQSVTTSDKFGPTNLRRLVTCLLGRDLTVGDDGKPEAVKLTPLFNQPFTGFVDKNEKGYSRLNFKTVRPVKGKK